MEKITILKSKSISTSEIEPNKGQIDGLPKNPRFIRDYKYEKLKKSIEDNPEMLGARELIVFPFNSKYVIIGGNMRFRAAVELGYKELPCKILAENTTAEQLRAITIKDNVSFGDNEWETLANEWDAEELEDWGLTLPMFNNDDIDYTLLDNDEMDDKINEMSDGVKKAIQIEFEFEHYEEAFELVKFWREQKLYIGGFLMEKLKEEKEKL